MLRFPRGGKIHKDYIDEKVIMEVRVFTILRQTTTVPIPEIHAWGCAAENPLGLGPFMIMTFINGVSLSDVLDDPQAEEPTRLMKEDINDGDIELIYKQFANILLQLFKLDFEQIGSLPLSTDQSEVLAPRRPLTYKAHSIMQSGGVNTFGDRNKGFPTTTEYLQYLVKQDLEQLDGQPNSTTGKNDAKSKWESFNALLSLVPELVNSKSDCGKCKLICDDLGLANLIVRSKDDLTIVGVIDLEWSYIGPAQIAASAPWWLLQDRPVNTAWDCNVGRPLPNVAHRYSRYLKIFMRVLEEEETKLHGHEQKEFSNLVKWSQESGAMWLHMLLASGFMDQRSLPFTKLRDHLGSTWRERVEQFQNAEEVEPFATRKMQELEQYDEDLEKMEKDKELMKRREMSRKDFLDIYMSK